MGGEYYVKHPQDYSPYPGTREAFQAFQRANIPTYIVTNQSCIARGLDGGYDFAAEFRDIGATDWFICPHDLPDKCHCRKPETGLIEQARDRYHLDLARCYMKEIANTFHINDCYLSHLFKDSIGLSPSAYLTEFRINEACRLLSQTDMPIHSIASKVGYQNQSNFQIQFKKNKGLSPLQYRAYYEKNPLIHLDNEYQK